MEYGATGKRAERGPRGAAATAHPLATRAAMDVLRSGGNAADASVAAGAVMNVVEPPTSHLGGDSFLLIRSARTGQVHAINASGPAPAAARVESYGSGPIPVRGLRSSTIPGEVAGWELAVRLFGTQPFGDLLHPATGYASEGFPVSRRLAEAIASSADLLRASPAAARTYLPHDRPPAVGDMLVQPRLADTLRAIAVGGAEEFYRHGLGSAIGDWVTAHGGDVSAADLAEYTPHLVEPLSAEWRGLQVHVQPPVSQAPVMLEALLIAEEASARCSGPEDPAWLHVCIEAIKIAFADRHAYAGDPSFVEFDAHALVTPAFIAKRRAALSRERASDYAAGALGDGDTTQIAVADEDGNAVCLIQSLFHLWGCGVYVEDAGIFLNNRLTGFELDPTHHNALEPGKRPVHTLCTYMVTSGGQLTLVGGTPGGMRQPQTNLQVLSAMLAFGDDPQVAVERPRWAIEDGGRVAVEGHLDPASLAALRAMGHELEVVAPLGVGGCAQVIVREPNGVFAAGSDPRGDGCAEAF